MPKKRKVRDNKKLTHRTLTDIFCAVYEPELSEAIYEAARQQIAVRNLTTEHLIAHGPNPVRVTPKTPNALFGQYQSWRETEHPWLNDILQVIWRPAVEDAADAYNKWEETNYDHCVGIAEALDASKKPKGNKKPKGIPKHIQKRRPDPKTLFVSRKRRDREHRHTVRIAERVQVLDGHTIKLPSIGKIRLKERIPDGMDVRAATLVERTPKEKGRRIEPAKRTWNVHLHYRVAAKLRPLPEAAEEIRSTGGDNGVVHALTISRSDGTSEYLHYPPPKAVSVQEWNRAACQKAKLKRGSRTWNRLTAKQAAIRRHETNRRKNERTRFANEIAKGADIVGIEDLANARMQRSATGTSEAPGTRVAAKRGLNRRLRETAPGYQTEEQKQACDRHGTRYFLVPGARTSITCSVCRHCTAENRKSQAGFRCEGCQHTANADVNAAENMRLAALAHYGVGVDRSPGAPTPEESLSWGAAMTASGPEGERRGRKPGGRFAAETPRPG